MTTQAPHTWKFYALLALWDFVGLFLLDMLIEGGYTHRILVHDLIAAAIFTAIIWFVDRKPFKKKK